MEPIIVRSAAGAAALIAVHLLAGRFHTLVGPRKRPFHSLLTGITTGYLFLKLLPELAVLGTAGLDLAAPGIPPGRALYLFALLGFAGYYSLEVWTYSVPDGAPVPPARVYRTHLGAFVVFNIVIGFLVPHHVQHGLWIAAGFLVAVGVHLLVLDHTLAEAHGGRFGWVARMLHSAGLITGLGLAILLGPVPPARATATLLAFFAGALILQVIRQEVPEHRHGHPVALALGAAAFAVLLALAEVPM